MTSEVIAELTVEHGPDSCAWGENGRRHAVVEALAQDESQKSPDLLSDALSEIVLNTKTGAQFRRSIIEALGHQQVGMRLAALGKAIETPLMNYVLEQLEGLAEEREGEWLAEQRQCQAETDYDSRAEERLLRGVS